MLYTIITLINYLFYYRVIYTYAIANYYFILKAMYGLSLKEYCLLSTGEITCHNV